MKTLFSSLAALLVITLMAGCIKNKTTRTFSITRPVYKLKQEVYNDIKTHPAVAIMSAGKLFIKGNYIFLSEKNKGIHIINNSNPLSPVNESFIPLPGTEDVVVKGNILMADCFIDLLSIDISNPLDVKVVNTAMNVFPERRYVNGYDLDSNMVITEWITKDTTTTVEFFNQYKGGVFATFDVQTMSGGGTNNSTGVGGSMARFTLVNNYLYTVSTSTLRTFDVTNPVLPLVKNNVNLGWNIETIYPVNDKLFIGSQTGVFVYSIANPVNPTQLCTFSHASMCDPVIADNNYAYITLRSGTTCQGFSNQLEIVDISNISSLS